MKWTSNYASDLVLKDRRTEFDPDLPRLERLQKAIGYRFKDSELLLRSITHPSFFQQKSRSIGQRQHNQRLEYLGDAILSAILAEHLFKLMPSEREGILSQGRSALSRGTHLAELSRKLGVASCIRMSSNEERQGGRNRASILEDALEALIAAIYLDSDWETAREVILSWYGDVEGLLAKYIHKEQNPKGSLQELVQPKFGNNALAYTVTAESGPAHNRTFRVEVSINGKSMGSGEGASKKEAEETAAKSALSRWGYLEFDGVQS